MLLFRLALAGLGLAPSPIMSSPEQEPAALWSSGMLGQAGLRILLPAVFSCGLLGACLQRGTNYLERPALCPRALKPWDLTPE